MKNRKRVLSVLLALAVVFTMCITAAVAVDTGSGSAATITVETVKKAVNVGDTVTLNVSIAGNPGFAGYKFKVNYDANKLTLKEVTNGTFAGEAFKANPDKNTVVFGNSTDFHEDGTLFTLKFTVKADCSNGVAVTIENAQIANAAQKDVTATMTIVAGGINVTTGGSTTGGTGSTTGGTGSTTGGTGSTTGGTGSTTGGTGSTTGGTGSTTGGTGSTTGGTGSTTGGTGSTTGGTGSTTGGTGSTTGGTGSTANYEIIEGANGTWTQNSDGTLTFRANGEFSKFKGVKVDGKFLIAGKDYTAKSGSTIVTLSKDYLATLSVGQHSLTVVFNDGECSTDFTVKAAGDNTNPGDNTKPGETVTPGNNADGPQTGDHSSIVLAVAVLLVSGGALTVLAIAKKKAGKC